MLTKRRVALWRAWGARVRAGAGVRGGGVCGMLGTGFQPACAVWGAAARAVRGGGVALDGGPAAHLLLGLPFLRFSVNAVGLRPDRSVLPKTRTRTHVRASVWGKRL